MDEGDIDFSSMDAFQGIGSSDVESNCLMGDFFNDIFTDAPHQHACTHTHTCTPPGRDLSHTHTCFHVHTKILSAHGEAVTTTDETSESTEPVITGEPLSKKQKPCGNREAVRKYREKKKALTASLENEVVHLRAMNQELMRKLQNQAGLEAELMRLRCLLVDLRGRIEGEIGSSLYQRTLESSGNAQNINPCDFRCNDSVNCLCFGAAHGRLVGDDCGGATGGMMASPGCKIPTLQCMGGPSSGPRSALRACGSTDVVPVSGLSDPER